MEMATERTHVQQQTNKICTEKDWGVEMQDNWPRRGKWKEGGTKKEKKEVVDRIEKNNLSLVKTAKRTKSKSTGENEA